jgi:hypothetical protein
MASSIICYQQSPCVLNVVSETSVAQESSLMIRQFHMLINVVCPMSLTVLHLTQEI